MKHLKILLLTFYLIPLNVYGIHTKHKQCIRPGKILKISLALATVFNNNLHSSSFSLQAARFRHPYKASQRISIFQKPLAYLENPDNSDIQPHLSDPFSHLTKELSVSLEDLLRSEQEALKPGIRPDDECNIISSERSDSYVVVASNPAEEPKTLRIFLCNHNNKRCENIGVTRGYSIESLKRWECEYRLSAFLAWSKKAIAEAGLSKISLAAKMNQFLKIFLDKHSDIIAELGLSLYEEMLGHMDWEGFDTNETIEPTKEIRKANALLKLINFSTSKIERQGFFEFTQDLMDALKWDESNRNDDYDRISFFLNSK